MRGLLAFCSESRPEGLHPRVQMTVNRYQYDDGVFSTQAQPRACQYSGSATLLAPIRPTRARLPRYIPTPLVSVEPRAGHYVRVVRRRVPKAHLSRVCGLSAAHVRFRVHKRRVVAHLGTQPRTYLSIRCGASGLGGPLGAVAGQCTGEFGEAQGFVKPAQTTFRRSTRPGSALLAGVVCPCIRGRSHWPPSSAMVCNASISERSCGLRGQGGRCRPIPLRCGPGLSGGTVSRGRCLPRLAS